MTDFYKNKPQYGKKSIGQGKKLNIYDYGGIGAYPLIGRSMDGS
jgi:hypothetical protein